MPKKVSDFLELHPFRVAFLRTVYPPKEFVWGVPREYPDHPLDENGDEITPDYPAGLPRGEVHKIDHVIQIYYDVAGTPEDPHWRPMTEVLTALDAENLSRVLQDLNELPQPEEET